MPKRQVVVPWRQHFISMLVDLHQHDKCRNILQFFPKLVARAHGLKGYNKQMLNKQMLSFPLLKTLHSSVLIPLRGFSKSFSFIVFAQ
jgi:hypothetical protein